MTVLGEIVGEGGAGVAKGLLEGIGSLGDHVRSWITGEPNPETRAKLEETWMQVQSLLAKGQIDVNIAEAKSTSIFVAGWRPFIGWVCGIAIAWNMVVYPMVTWGMAIWMPQQPVPPTIPLSALYPVVMGMLGLGGLRSWEKQRDVQGKH